MGYFKTEDGISSKYAKNNFSGRENATVLSLFRHVVYTVN